jgi:small nuclear ribonucleoprotein (snRNP)-like protein
MIDGFTITIIFIFLAAIIGAVLNSRAMDRCLKTWNGYHVAVEEKDGKTIWGTMKLFPTGIELDYLNPVLDRQGHHESSYIIYKDQYSSMHVIYRYLEDIPSDQKLRRSKEIKSLQKRVLVKLLWRKIRNIFNTLKDAVAETFSIILGKVKSGRIGAITTKTGTDKMEQIGKNIIGYSGTTFDPLLERHLYRRVVIEITKENLTTEYTGILKEYSGQFLEVLAVKYPTQKTYRLPMEGEEEVQLKLKVLAKNGKCFIENSGTIPVYLTEIRGKNFKQNLNVIVKENGNIDFPLPEPIPEDLELTTENIQNVDMILPRTHTIIRHSGEIRNKGNALKELFLFHKGNDD